MDDIGEIYELMQHLNIKLEKNLYTEENPEGLLKISLDAYKCFCQVDVHGFRERLERDV